MSTTSIFAVKQGEAPIPLGEVRNAWRGAMYVWSDMAKRYFGLEAFPFSDDEMQSRVWNAGNEKPLTEAELIVLASTMDKAIAPKTTVHKLLDAFREYGSDHPDSSLGDQADLISGNLSDIPDGYAIAWIQTSVCGDRWFESWDEDSGKPTCKITEAFDLIEQSAELYNQETDHG